MIWGVIVLVMILFGATLMKDAPQQAVKTVNGVVENDFTLAQSMASSINFPAENGCPKFF